MIGDMSPFTRRIVATGLLVLMVLLGFQYAVVPLVSGIVDQRDELASLKMRGARLRATMDRSLPTTSSVRPEQVIAAASPAQATQRFQALLTGNAARASVTLQLGPPCPARLPQLLCADITVVGKEVDVAHFLSLVEHGPPVIRFRQWHLAPDQATNTQLHVTGQAVAMWAEPA